MAQQPDSNPKDDASTAPWRPDPDATPSFKLTGTPTPTEPTPDGYRPPQPPLTNLPDDYDPPHGVRFRFPQFHKKGGMGRVFSVADSEFDRRVALKDIQPVHRDSTTYRRKFLFEAAITGALEHPGIVPVYSLYRPDADGHPYYAMRFIEGQSLTAAIADFHVGLTSTKRLSATHSRTLHQLLQRFLSVCQTVAYAHSRKVIHRDLKPDNIMLGPFGETLVVDWGLAKRLTDGETGTPDHEIGAAVAVSVGGGTPGYWSPEQATRRSADHTERTDVYGLGAVLFSILAGRPPHPSGRHGTTPPHPRDWSAWVDAEMDSIVVRALALDPMDRYPTALDLAAVVENWLTDQPIAAQRATVANYRSKLEENADDSQLREQYLKQLVALGYIQMGLGRDSDALATFEEALAIDRRLVVDNANEPRYVADLANIHLALAGIHERTDANNEAKSHAARALQLFEQLRQHSPKDYRFNFATIHLTAANVRELLEKSRPSPPAEAVPQSDKTDPPTRVRTPSTAPQSQSETDPKTGEWALTRQPDADVRDEGIVLKDQIPEYVILKKLGTGGMAEVWLARDLALGRLVAIKALRMTEPRNERTIEHFRREALASANLNHPNIIRFFHTAWTRNGGYPYHVYEYIDGPSLREVILQFHDRKERLERKNPTFRSLLKLFVQVCHALDYAHRHGVIHRDVKPQNILIRGDQAILYDWGIARIQWLTELPAQLEDRWRYRDSDVDTTDLVLGTPAFMSPEIVKGQAKPSPRSDIYGMGVTLYFLLTGDMPFRSPEMYELMQLIASGPEVSPRGRRSDVPKELDAICARCLKHRPEDRFPTAGELADALTTWLQKRSLLGG